jgi:site-specific recombinase XerD
MRPKKKPPGKRRARHEAAEKYLQPDEIEQIKIYLNKLPETYQAQTTRLITEIILCAGLRIHEVSELLMRDLPHNRETNTLLVEHGTGNVEREVNIDAEFTGAIKQYCQRWRKHSRINSPLFKSRQGGHMSNGAIWRRIDNIRKDTGLEVTSERLRWAARGFYR